MHACVYQVPSTCDRAPTCPLFVNKLVCQASSSWINFNAYSKTILECICFKHQWIIHIYIYIKRQTNFVRSSIINIWINWNSMWILFQSKCGTSATKTTVFSEDNQTKCVSSLVNLQQFIEINLCIYKFTKNIYVSIYIYIHI